MRKSRVDRPRVTIIAPIFNEEGSLHTFLKQLEVTLSGISVGIDLHFCGINNGSEDSTLEMLKGYRSSIFSMSYITLTRNFGYEAAFEAGLRSIESDIYILIDADGEDPPEVLLKFYEAIENGFELAYGIRGHRHESRILQTARKYFYKLLFLLSDEPFNQNVGEFSMFTKLVRDSILKDNNSYPFFRSSLARIGFPSIGILHNRNPRIAGKSKLNKRKMFEFAFGGLLSTTTSPLRFSAYLLVSIFPLHLLFLVLYFSLDIPGQGYLVILSYSICSLAVAVATLAIYQARIYRNLLMRPNYFINPKETCIDKVLLQPRP
jgi:glycosyltransferase involved in cell wall biosynthesis